MKVQNPKIKLVAFDWNGTLLADTVICCKIDNEIFKNLNKPQISLKRFRDTFDVPISNLYLANGFTKAELQKNSDYIVNYFHDTYEVLAAKARTRTGTRQTLAWLRKQKILVIIFSNHTLDGLHAQMKRLKIGKYFDAIIGNDGRGGSFKGRTKKEKLAAYIKKKGIDFNEVLVVGDTIEEIEIGKALHTRTAALTEGNHSAKLLRKEKPDFLINNLAELKRIILKSKA